MKILQWEHFDERERAKIGDQAEMYVRKVISSYGEGTLLRGPLIPNIDNYGHVDGFRESDFLVYTQGTVFCIEVKYYAGTITYLPLYSSPPQAWHGNASNTQKVFQGYDTSKIMQVKPGRRGELIEKTYSNPLKKTKSFIGLLKRFVARVEPRFQRLFIIPVVCFDKQADIRAIYNFQEGIIQIEQLPAFFLQHRNEQFAFKPSPWISETILNKIPNWDRVQTTGGEWINGILVEPHLTFIGPDNVPYFLPNYATIKMINWQHLSGLTYTLMTVTYVNGVTQRFHCMGGQLSLTRGGQSETLYIQNLQYLVIGLANKMAL